MLKRPKKKRRWLSLLLIFSLLFGTGLFFHIRGLNNVIEKKFNVAQRWNIPSRVYADTEYLFAGVSVSERNLYKKLERLGYRQVTGEVKTAGDFVWGTHHIDIFLHNFFYPQEKFTGFPVRLQLAGTAIREIIDLESNEVLTLVRLEPEEIATLFDEKMEDRTLVALKECPQYLLEAVILIEDERFFKHQGVDPVAILRALMADLLSFRLAQGGSTLTQQLVKNFFLTSEKSIKRKIDEALMSLLIETKYSKGEILEAYLNEIYLGQRGPSSVTGVGEAAKHYFAKEIHQITLAEAALMAGMIRFPGRYSPLRDKQVAKDRRDFVLKRMKEADVIDEKQYQTAIQEPIITPIPKFKPVVAPFFIDFLKMQLADLYPQEILEAEGLKIFTTLDMEMQQKAEAALQEGLGDLEGRFGNILPAGRQGELQGCLVVMSPQNGYIRAMVGGRDYMTNQFNHCTQAHRQPGSTFKPFVFLTALDPSRSKKEFTPASLIEDRSFTIDTPLGPWTPQNYDKTEHGLVTLRSALEKSFNIATAKLAIETGLDEIIQTARDAGITSPLSPVPSLALGAFEVTPLELVSAYTVFPNRGVKAQGLSVINVMTKEGEALEKKFLKIKKVFDEKPIALTNQILKGVIDRGTAAASRAMGFKGMAAGKTGTTSNYRDAWFVGFTRELLSLVWVGFDDNTPIQMSGSRAALPIWVSLMKEVAPKASQDFPFPQGIVEVNIDPSTGQRASKRCTSKLKEYFIEGTEPSETCSHEKSEGLLPPSAAEIPLTFEGDLLLPAEEF